MKVMHIDSGLGNQMLSYAEYLILKKLNPTEDCYIETIVYDIAECNEVICQWNGYELKRIFGIDAPNIKTIFTDRQWGNIIKDVKKTEFWNDNWKYASSITNALNKQGLHLKNIIDEDANQGIPNTIKNKFLGTRLGYDLKRLGRKFYEKKYIERNNCSSKIFIKSDEDVFTGPTYGLCNRGINIDFIRKEILEAFRFPALTEERNISILEKIKSCNSVAIHARRGDMLQVNGYCYKYGYFKRATKYIRKHVNDPVFFFFCDTDSIQWCKENQNIFGLNLNSDEVYFIDWNKGNNSYIDMQLMGFCKHNIITNSSFGWWGTFFNNNPNKITCSPRVLHNTTIKL